MKAIVFHGYGSSPSRIKWLVKPFKEVCTEVEVPKVPSPLVKAWESFKDVEADIYAGHSMGGALALLLAAKFKRPAIAVAPPTDLKWQMEYLKENLPEIYEEIVSQVNLEDMYKLSPMNFEYEAPILVIHGSEDSVVPVDQSVQFCKRARTCELMIIDGMGHKPVTEEQKRSIENAIKEFVESVRRYYEEFKEFEGAEGL